MPCQSLTRPATWIAAVVCGFTLLPGTAAASVRVAVSPPTAGPRPSLSLVRALGHGTSPPLGRIKPVPAPRHMPQIAVRPGRQLQLPFKRDPVVQHGLRSARAAAAPKLLQDFDGVGQGFKGPQGTFTVPGDPSDANSSVGAMQVVETVNDDLAVFSKTGTTQFGPVTQQSVFSGLKNGGLCPSNGEGDATVRYDAMAGRWVLSYFAFKTDAAGNPLAPYFECVAVSQTSDATGAWNRYAFQVTGAFPDYPKIAVWPDAYYVTYNLFAPGASSPQGDVCALNRAAMLAGKAAPDTPCFTVSRPFSGLLPADMDGTSGPPSGEPEVVLALGATNTTLDYWRFSVDWQAPAKSKLSGPVALKVAAYNPICDNSGCVPQHGTPQQLAGLGDRIMYRLAYRNLGGRQILVTDDSVSTGNGIGVRWYEFQLGSNGLAVDQQSTYQPDSTDRWMGSIDLDEAGNIALGYSASSSQIDPGIRFTARRAGDPPGQMTLGEQTIINGRGSQRGAQPQPYRWGDYTSMATDPTDGCTFWYTNQYLPANGIDNWHTRLAAFRLPGCPPVVPSKLSYTGARTADYHDAFTASATLSAGGSPVAGAPITFTLGSGLPGETCTATTNSAGSAACTLTPEQAAGQVPLTAVFAGNATTGPARTAITFTITREETTLAYTGQKRIANGVPARFTAVLKEDGVTPVSGRQVTIAIGTGSTRQECTGTTGGDGTAACDITPNQPLDSTATVPLLATFSGDPFYLPSSTSATLLLQYMTGRAYGISANVNLPLISVGLPPQPDTGLVRTAGAVTVNPGCAATVTALILSAQALCPKVVTTIAPGTVTATSTVAQARIGVPGLPVISVSGLDATASASCTTATASATLRLSIGGQTITVPTAPNSTIPLPGGSITINEQTPVAGADHGITERAFHLRALNGAVDVVLGYATGASHNCV